MIPAEAISAPVVPVDFLVFPSAFEQANLEFLGRLVARYSPLGALEMVKKYLEIKCAELNLLPFGVIENSWDALRLGIQPFFVFCIHVQKVLPKRLQSGGKVTTK